MKKISFHDSERALKFFGFNALDSLVEVQGNASGGMLEAFGEIKSLRSLSISKPSCPDLSWLRQFNLRALEIAGGSKLRSLTGLEAQCNMEYFRILATRNFSSLEDVSKCGGIKYFMFDECRSIASLEPIRHLKHLELISFLGDTIVEDGRISVIDDLNVLAHVRFCDRKNYDRKSHMFRFDMNLFYEAGRQYWLID